MTCTYLAERDHALDTATARYMRGDLTLDELDAVEARYPHPFLVTLRELEAEITTPVSLPRCHWWHRHLGLASTSEKGEA